MPQTNGVVVEMPEISVRCNIMAPIAAKSTTIHESLCGDRSRDLNRCENPVNPL